MSRPASLQEHQEQAAQAAERTESRPSFLPRCDIYETERGLTLLADLPGVSEQNASVSLENGVLTLTGKMEPEEHPGYEGTYAEYRVGDFERSFRLSDDFEASQISASLKNGVLRVELPKAAEAKPRKIAVRAE